MIPLVYLVQFNTFLFSAMGLKCCARCTRGGGPGAPLPFRIFVDSGVVFLCIVALAPACPMVAPVGMLYVLERVNDCDQSLRVSDPFFLRVVAQVLLGNDSCAAVDFDIRPSTTT